MKASYFPLEVLIEGIIAGMLDVLTLGPCKRFDGKFVICGLRFECVTGRFRSPQLAVLGTDECAPNQIYELGEKQSELRPGH